MCGPEFSDLEAAIWQRFQDDDVVVLGINGGPDPIEDLEVFVDAFQISFPILLDEAGVIDQYRQGGAISPFPLDYVIDPEGNVAYYATEYDPAAMSEVIETLLETSTPVDEPLPPPVAIGLVAAPNPFNPRTVVTLDLPAASAVTLEVHDSRGRRLRRLLADEAFPAGRHDLAFDGRDAAGRDLPTGVYLLRLDAGGNTISRKLTLLR